MANRPVKTDWSKYEIDANGDFATDPNGDFVEKAKPAKAEPAPREQVTFLGSDNLGKLMADVFPRVARETVKGSGYGKQVGAGILDELSLPGRGVAASGEAPNGTKFLDGNPSLGKIKGDGFVENVLRDPGTGAALLAAPLTGGLSLVPEVAAAGEIATAARLANYARVAGQGAVAGAASATAHQGERALDGQGVSLPQTAGEIALSTLLPVGARVGGGVLQAGGKKILNTILKLKEGVQEQVAKTGYKTIADLIFKHNLDSPIPFRGGVSGIESRNNALRAKANDEFGKILDDADRVVTVTSKAPPAQAAAGKTGINVSGGQPDVMYAAPSEMPAIEGGSLRIPESTIPAAPDVIRAGMNRPALLTDGKPGIVITPAPRSVAQPPGVVITPNAVEMPNRIDPRFARPTATATPNQPQIGRLNPGEAHGIPSDRNLPALAGGRGLAEIPPPEGIPLQGADALTPEELKLLGRAPSVPTVAVEPGTVPPGASAQGPLRLPPGTPETVTDLTKSIDLQKAIDDAFSQLSGEFQATGKHAGVLLGIDQGKDYWEGALARKTDGGEVPVRFSQGFKQEAGDAGNFLSTDPGEVKGKARFANALYRAIRGQQNELMPELIPLNQTLSETHPIKEALADAIPRLEKNNLITPSDLWTLGPAAFGGGVGLHSGGPVAGSLAFAAPLIANRLSKNPTFASQMYRFGESMIDPGTASLLRKRAIERMLATGLYGNQ